MPKGKKKVNRNGPNTKNLSKYCEGNITAFHTLNESQIGVSVKVKGYLKMHTCLMNVIGFCPIAWQSPMLAFNTSLKGFFTPCKWKRNRMRFLGGLPQGGKSLRNNRFIFDFLKLG